MIPSRVTRDCVNTQEVGAVNSPSLSCQSKENCHPFRVWGVFKCDGAQFQRDCNTSKNAGTQLSGKGNQGKSWSKSESSITGRGKGKEVSGKSTGRFLWTGEGAIQVSKGSGNGKTLKTGFSSCFHFFIFCSFVHFSFSFFHFSFFFIFHFL